MIEKDWITTSSHTREDHPDALLQIKTEARIWLGWYDVRKGFEDRGAGGRAGK
jgi:hypothetical protein